MNAIIMAAGTSSRFAPLSYELPKGLLNVKGEILIERQIRQLQEAGISDITIVVGYKAELFHYLADKFNVNIVINEDYNQYNNTSSIIRVIDKLENTYICSSDNYFPNNVFIDKSSDSYYSALYANGTTHEYCITADAQDNIISVKVGGADSWYMVGHVFFNKEYSEKFREIMIKEYPNEETKKVYWEDIYIKHIEELPPMKIRYYKPHDIEEFDTLEELRLFDDNYINHTGSKIFQNICSILQCKEMDIYNINVLKKGMTNCSFAFTCQKDGKTYVYRQPGEGTEAFISRKSEYFSMQIAKQLKLDTTFIYMHPTEGWKLSSYIEDAKTLDYHNPENVMKAVKLLAKLHEANIQSEYPYRLWDQANDFLQKLQLLQKDNTPDFYILKNRIKNLYELANNDGWPECLNHCDALAANFLIDSNGNMTLIDWEYSGQGDTAQDIGSFIACSDMNYDEAIFAITQYLGHQPSNEELRHYFAYTAIASYCWYLWAIYQETNGIDTGDYLDMWYKYSYLYSEKAAILYNQKERVKP